MKQIKGIQVENTLVAGSNLPASSLWDFFLKMALFLRVRHLATLAIKNPAKSH